MKAEQVLEKKNVGAIVEYKGNLIQDIKDSLEFETIKDLAKSFGFRKQHVDDLLAGNKKPKMIVVNKLLAGRPDIKIAVGDLGRKEFKYTVDGMYQAYLHGIDQGLYKNYRDLSKISGIGYVTLFELTKKVKDNTWLATIKRYADACNVRIII